MEKDTTNIQAKGFKKSKNGTERKAVIRIKNVIKSFGDNNVLNGFNMVLYEGENLVVMGKSGSGKSTLLYILSTMDTDYEGELYFNNELITGKKNEELSRIRNKNIGFVFQFHYLLSEFSVLENVMLPAKKLAEKSFQEIEHNAMEKLRMLHIEHLAHKKASRISGGEKQRVAIARALINNPTLLMGDEPTGNLDSQILKDLKEKEGLSLLIVTHDIDFAKRTDRIIEMEDGKIIKQ